MNYMPFMFEVHVPRGGASITTWCEALVQDLVLSAKVTRDHQELMFSHAGAFAVIEFSVPDREFLARSPHRVHDRIEASWQVRVISGPNHYYRHYLPIFCDVKLAAFQQPGALWLPRGDQDVEPLELSGDPEGDAKAIGFLFAHELGSLVTMLTNIETNELWERRSAAQVASKLVGLLPPGSLEDEDLEQLLHGLRGDEDDTAPIHQLLRTMPSIDIVPLLDDALFTEDPSWPAMAYALQQPDLARLSESTRRKLHDECDAEQPWVRWAAAQMLGLAGDDARLIERLTDPAEVRLVTEGMESGLRFSRLTDFPNEEYFEFIEKNRERFEGLLEATASLCEARTLVPADDRIIDEERWLDALSQWESLSVATSDKDVARHAMSISTALAKLLF